MHGFNPDYCFMLRHYSLSWFDTVLYAVDGREPGTISHW